MPAHLQFASKPCMAWHLNTSRSCVIATSTMLLEVGFVPRHTATYNCPLHGHSSVIGPSPWPDLVHGTACHLLFDLRTVWHHLSRCSKRTFLMTSDITCAATRDTSPLESVSVLCRQIRCVASKSAASRQQIASKSTANIQQIRVVWFDLMP